MRDLKGKKKKQLYLFFYALHDFEEGEEGGEEDEKT